MKLLHHSRFLPFVWPSQKRFIPEACQKENTLFQFYRVKAIQKEEICSDRVASIFESFPPIVDGDRE